MSSHLVLAGLAALTSPAQDAELPAASELLAKMYASFGSEEDRARVRGLSLHGKATWLGIEGTGQIAEVLGGLGEARGTIEFPFFGKFEMGADGALAWERSPHGVKVRSGWDACQHMRTWGMIQHVDWRRMYASARTVGVDELDGERCFRVDLIPRAFVEMDAEAAKEIPSPDACWIDAESFRPRRFEATVPGTFEGTAMMRIDYADWREVDGVAYAHRSTVEINGFELVHEYHSIEPNPGLPAGFFELEDDVRQAAADQCDPRKAQDDSLIRIVTLEPRDVAAIRVQCKHADMQKTLAVILPELARYAMSVGATLDGPPSVRYYTFGEDLDIEGVVCVSKPVEPKGRVKPATLPGGPAVIAWHVGPYDRLGDTHARIQAYLGEHGLERRGACWEEYWTDPGMEPDPSKWRTRIVTPIVEQEEGGSSGD